MKKLITLMVLASAGPLSGLLRVSLAHAESTGTFCTASGLDGMHHEVQVSGDLKNTEAEAKSSALNNCRISGLSLCEVRSCIEEPTGL